MSTKTALWIVVWFFIGLFCWPVFAAIFGFLISLIVGLLVFGFWGIVILGALWFGYHLLTSKPKNLTQTKPQDARQRTVEKPFNPTLAPITIPIDATDRGSSSATITEDDPKSQPPTTQIILPPDADKPPVLPITNELIPSNDFSALDTLWAERMPFGRSQLNLLEEAFIHFYLMNTLEPSAAIDLRRVRKHLKEAPSRYVMVKNRLSASATDERAMLMERLAPYFNKDGELEAVVRFQTGHARLALPKLSRWIGQRGLFELLEITCTLPWSPDEQQQFWCLVAYDETGEPLTHAACNSMALVPAEIVPATGSWSEQCRLSNHNEVAGAFLNTRFWDEASNRLEALHRQQEQAWETQFGKHPNAEGQSCYLQLASDWATERDLLLERWEAGWRPDTQWQVKLRIPWEME